MVVFCSDLDNTLIYSYKREIGSSKLCVEIYEGREVSFMTSYSCQLMKKLKEKICLVPVTTRTLEQYKRIRLPAGEPEFALTANGGILLVNGEEDHKWYEESLHLTACSAGELTRARRLLEQDQSRCFEVRNIRDLFLFTKSENPKKTVDNLKRNLDTGKIEVFENGVKVYAVPKELNKGRAVKRLRKRLGDCFVIGAGDSEFDIPLLWEADHGFLPDSLGKITKQSSHWTVCENQKVFSDQILETIAARIEEQEA